jgi:hypothetical protein
LAIVLNTFVRALGHIVDTPQLPTLDATLTKLINAGVAIDDVHTEDFGVTVS